ncbi:MAG: S46 family peptidase [Culturomica sp.]|jgi:hypothetical protein|nr:S46 family peptidase [Culturomica sp.]
MKKILISALALLCFVAAKADEGMWLLSLLKEKNIDKMHELGFKLSAEDIYSLNQPGIKDAIVGLGTLDRPFRHFCTAEIVSPRGLLITNHHCAFSSIQEHSSVEHDYLSDGFWAYQMSDELTNSGMTASILERMEDVTERVLSVLDEEMDAVARATAVDSIGDVIVKEAVEGTVLTGQVISMFEGNQYFLFLYTIYKDVRLVAAPPQSMGKFGGDTDNWIWPRHTCDFSMLRIYTGPDGQPAEYAPENIPLKPKHHLPVSLKGIRDNDFAMVMGFPGTTNRYATSYSLATVMDVINAVRYKARTVILAVMKEEMSKSPKTRIQYASKYASCANYWKYSFEQNKALKRLNTLGHKQEIEAEFTRWLNADAGRKAQYAEVLPSLQKAIEASHKYVEAGAYLTEAFAGPELHQFAYSVSGLLEALFDKQLPETERAEIVSDLKQNAKAFYKDYNVELDARLFADLFRMYSDEVGDDLHPAVIDLINQKYKGDYARFAEEIRLHSLFRSEEALLAFIEKPDRRKLEKDPALIAGQSYTEMAIKLAAWNKENKTVIGKNNRLFVRGLLEMDPGKAVAPNANSTLRLTYGRVRSYVPRDAVFYNYYTTLTGVMEKEGPAGGEFEVPARLKELYGQKEFAPYGTDNVVACFITDNDITGGNSGSPVINANGELIGTAFDGNSEAMSGDIDFEENLQRCISVDVRYVLFVLDKYAGARNLIEEMTIVE